MIAEIILWSSAGLLAWAYIVYPGIAFTAARLKRKKDAISDKKQLPGVSVLMAVYNEKTVIEKKLAALLASDYPHDKIEFLVGSDASDDGTDEVIQRFASFDNRIIYYKGDVRAGKASVLNKLFSMASGEIIMITDANVMPSPATIRLLAKGFHDPLTGLCDGTVVTVSDGSDGLKHQENTYSRFETALKRAEGEAWGTMTGPYGGFYALRRNLFPVIPQNMLADDLFIGLKVLKTGYHAINISEAKVYEDTQYELPGQFKRRVRIAAGAFQNLFHYGPFPGRKLSALVSFLSHKVLRWSGPLFLILIFMTTVILSGHSNFYFCLFAAQLFLIFLTAFDLLLYSVKINLRPLRFVTQFMVMNTALAAGLIKALKGIKKGTWEPTKRF